MEEGFMDSIRSIDELYSKVMPALRSKVMELGYYKIDYINEKDIWVCLQNKVWKSKTNLDLYDMICDIYDLKPETIKEDYLKRKSRV